MPQTTISNADLRIKDIPQSNADWEEIVPFARAFNGYTEGGSFANAGDLANEYRTPTSKDRLPLTLTELRICLFFEYRRWNHRGRKPNDENLQFIRSLVDQIRAKVEAGRIE